MRIEMNALNRRKNMKIIGSGKKLNEQQLK